MNHTISSLERQNQIHQYILHSQRISITDVCGNFSVSEATARRDLETLAKEGKIQRVHGGAIALTQAPPESPSSSARTNRRKKKSA